MGRELVASWQPPDSTTSSVDFQGLNFLNTPFFLVSGVITTETATDSVRMNLFDSTGYSPPSRHQYAYNADDSRYWAINNGVPTPGGVEATYSNERLSTYFEAIFTGWGATQTKRVNIASTYANTPHTNNYRNLHIHLRKITYSHDDSTNIPDFNDKSGHEYMVCQYFRPMFDMTLNINTTGNMSTDSFVKIYTLTE
jgi:hypothetical protein